jgi:hypothetical protein
MTADIQPRRLDNILRLIMWCGLLALWLVPLIAKQFTDEVQWTTFDHVAWAVMLAVPGTLVDLASRRTGNWAYRFGVILALGTAFVTTWANLAVGIVGIVGNEDNPINLVFFGVILVALIGAPLVGFKATQMRWVMIATAVAQVLSGLVALQAEAFVLVFCGIATALWLTSAALFAKAAKDQTAA